MSSAANYRLFIAIPLPMTQRGVLARWSDTMTLHWPFQSWVHPADYHITLQFLGACTFRQTREVKQAIRQVAAERDPFSLTVKGIGYFGVPTRPRILWAGVGGDRNCLQSLYEEVTRRVEPLCFHKEKRSYRPHITLAKKYKRNDFPHDRLEEIFSPDEEKLYWTVDEMILYQTHLYRSPMYQPLARFGFGDGKRVRHL
ncbi:RNA 2',3'-cyclic phosphodiesterase [Paludifilum halophilum]|nr:RNA 2',3'-cyclic phosphodiesterase [Paludifilum halophilum]